MQSLFIQLSLSYLNLEKDITMFVIVNYCKGDN